MFKHIRSHKQLSICHFTKATLLLHTHIGQFSAITTALLIHFYSACDSSAIQIVFTYLLTYLHAAFIYATADEAVAYMFYRCFFCFCFVFCICFIDVFFVFFSVRQNMRQPFSGTAERIFMKLLPNDTGKNVVCNMVPPPGEWRMLMICVIYAMTLLLDMAIPTQNYLCYDSGAITRGRLARRLHYKIMSGRMDLL